MKIPRALLGLFSIVVGLWLISFAFIILFVPASSNEPFASRGQFGDMFGAVNSLFSGLAMAGVIYTVWLQTKEIEAQRVEQSASETARQEQVALLSKQLAAMEEQVRFEKLRYRATTMPVFQWDGSTSNPDEIKMKFVNKGGALQDNEHSAGWRITERLRAKELDTARNGLRHYPPKKTTAS